MIKMEYIFHEKQEGSLCAQHCLNALLQEEYFTAVDLATLAQQMDEAERQRMAEASIHSEEYRRFLEQPSVNMDDTGFFSIQVIASALNVWNLELIPYKSRNPLALAANINPVHQVAFICNYRNHWFTVRKLGKQWFNLNSLLTGPELISDTYLAMFLAQLQQEGYSIFIVQGSLPDCEADNVLRLTSAVQVTKPRLISQVKTQHESKNSGSDKKSEDDADAQLDAALRLSLQEYQSNFSSGASNYPDYKNQHMNQRKQTQSSSDSAKNQSKNVIIDDRDDEMLQEALKLSMEHSETK